MLGLLHPQLDLQAVYVGLQSNSAAIYDNSLGFLDNVLKSRMRGILLPLPDGKVSVEEPAKLAERLVRAKVENREQAVVALISSDDPWLKACGAYVIGAFGMKSLGSELNRCLIHPDPLLRETARSKAQARSPYREFLNWRAVIRAHTCDGATPYFALEQPARDRRNYRGRRRSMRVASSVPSF